MSYKDLLAGLIFEGESFQALNNFTFMNYTNVQFCDDAGTPVSQRSGGICLLTNKRILFLSSQLTVGKYNSLLNIFVLYLAFKELWTIDINPRNAVMLT